MLNFLYTWLGLSNASGPIYLFWSGFFGDITIFGAIGFWWYHHNCHHLTCLRPGHPDANGHIWCKKHNPNDFYER